MDELSRILDTAEQFFQRYGIRSITMTDIARSLGMSKKTLYQHIQNKDELVEKTLRRSIEQDKERMELTRQRAENALDELLQMNIEVQQKVQTINPSLLYDLKKYHSRAWRYFEEFHRDFIYGTIRSNLERGIAEGVYRSDINPDILSKIYIGFFPIFTDYDFFPVQDYPRPLLLREFMLYHLHGIVSEQGRALIRTSF